MTITGAQVALSVGVVIVSGLLSGLVSYVVSNVNFRRFEKRKMKTDTLKRVAARRYVLTDVTRFDNDEFFGALNEVFVVFQDAPEVIKALETAHRSLGTPNFNDNLVRLFKLMCDDLDIDRSQLDDSFFLRPFVPNAGAPPGP